MIRLLSFVLFASLIYSCQQASTETMSKIYGDPDNAGLQLQEGFQALEVAADLGRIRHVAVRANGDIYMNLQKRDDDEGGIVALRDTTGDGKADIISYFTDVYGTGIGLYNGYLYYSTDSTVLRRQFIGDELIPSGKEELIVKGFEYRPQHAAKSFTFDNAGNLYVNVGAPSNACQDPDRTIGVPGQDPCPLLERFGGIWRFKADKLNQDQMEDGYRYATGLRNSVGVRWNDDNNELYAIPHGRDMLHNWYPDSFTMDDPAEELLLLTDGADAGWPYCYWDYESGAKQLNPEYGGDGTAIGRCESATDPIYAFPGHWAPNDLVFYSGNMFPETYKNGVFIAFHGSWNRAGDQRGYNVAFVPLKEGLPTGEHSVFADGFKGVDTLDNPRDAKYRPTGLAIGPDGSLFIADDKNGTLFRIVYTESQ